MGKELFEQLEGSLKESVAISKGETEPARVTAVEDMAEPSDEETHPKG
ncbi:hypothetical protein [Vibrio crassostreae]|nr:hypothetical protein [Vibrio crassostreae]